MKVKKKILIAIMICCAMAWAIFPLAETLAAEKSITLKAALFHPAAAPCTQVWHSYEPVFERVTKGRVLLKVYDSSTLIKSSAHVDAIQRGMCDVTFSWPGMMGQTVPEADLGTLPGLWRDQKGARDAYENGVMQVYEEGYAAHGLDNVRVIAMVMQGEYWIDTKKQIKVPSDLKGLKLRTSGANQVHLLKLCNAVPTRMRMGEAYEALQRGVIDGVFATTGNLHDMKWPEVAKYVLEVPFAMPAMAILASKKSLNNIPDDLRECVIELLKSCGLRCEAVRAFNNLYYKETYFDQAGVVFYKPTKQERAQWNAIQKKVFEKWLEKAGERGKKILTIAEKYNQM
jgi:TRAP-type C4-dicarboxylate transport system substrate-binding protein